MAGSKLVVWLALANWNLQVIAGAITGSSSISSLRAGWFHLAAKEQPESSVLFSQGLTNGRSAVSFFYTRYFLAIRGCRLYSKVVQHRR